MVSTFQSNLSIAQQVLPVPKTEQNLNQTAADNFNKKVSDLAEATISQLIADLKTKGNLLAEVN